LIHELALERRNLHGHFSRDLEPVLVVEPGDSVEIETLALESPCARIQGAWLTFGFDSDLDRAAQIALDGMVALMQREHGLDANDALALASVVVDLRVTQIVNGNLGVHAVLRDDAWQ
jgi:acetamidase/formamidase